jgi:hypothetical protein
MGVYQSDVVVGKGRRGGPPRPDFIVLMSPPGYPWAGLLPSRAGFRFTRQDQFTEKALMAPAVVYAFW